MYNKENKATRSPEISREQVQKLTPQFLLYIYILDIDSHCPYLLSGETTFQLTSCSKSYMYIYDLEKPPPHLTSKWRGTFQYFQFHDKMPYIYYLEKPPPI